MEMFNPPHPGEVLQELCFEPLGLTVAEVADALGVSPSSLAAVVAGSAAIIPTLAVRLAKALNTSAESWLQQQMLYDLCIAKREMADVEVRVLTAV